MKCLQPGDGEGYGDLVINLEEGVHQPMAVRYCYDIIYSAGYIIPYLIENIPIFTLNRLTMHACSFYCETNV